MQVKTLLKVSQAIISPFPIARVAHLVQPVAHREFGDSRAFNSTAYGILWCFDWQQRDNLWMVSISSKYQSEAGQASQSHGIGTKKRDAAKDFLTKPEVRSLDARLPPSTRRNRMRNPSDGAIPEVTSDPKGELQAGPRSFGRRRRRTAYCSRQQEAQGLGISENHFFGKSCY